MKKLINILEELKVKFSYDLFKTFITEMDNIILNDFYFDKCFSDALNGQNNEFYDELSFCFKEDFEIHPILYFTNWVNILSVLRESTLSYFFESCKCVDANTCFTDLINGLIELENDNFEIAILYFNRIDDHIACYFLGLCYLNLDNNENSIKNNLEFLEHLKKQSDYLKDKGFYVLDFDIVCWNVYNDLAYSYIKIYEFNKALNMFNKSLVILDLESNFNIRFNIKYGNKLDDFQLFVNNYLLALEKTENLEKANNVLDFAIKKYPDLDYYIKLKKEFNKKIGTDSIIRKVFIPRKPFDVSNFQSLKILSKEKSLEDMIVEQIKYGIKVFGKELEIYQDNLIYGRQYIIPEINGVLDLLLIEKKSNQLYLVELKRNKAGAEVVNQIENYITALSKQLNKDIKGIICLHKPDEALINLVKTKTNIELYTYIFEFKIL